MRRSKELLGKINELRGLEIDGWGFTTEDFFEDVIKVIPFRKIIDVQLLGSDSYCKYGDMLIRGGGKILVVNGCSEYFLWSVFDDVV